MAPPPSLASRRTRPPAEWFFFSFTVRIYSRYAGQDSMYCMGQVIIIEDCDITIPKIPLFLMTCNDAVAVHTVLVISDL